MKTFGRVISSNNDNVIVKVIRNSACGKSCEKCGSTCDMSYLISVNNDINAKNGEIVNIELNSNKVLKIAAVFYILPLFLIVLGIISIKIFLPISLSNTNSDLLAIFTGIFLYSICMVLIHKLNKNKNINYKISHRQF
ncbi:SoxR reducing system RseC family protein [Helicovermis profundi]|uniref:Uncharacterized protein n=1 Tax=Helicovermis profundi TaxID=3065157 RepID=A0AAU9EL42_9FIRM|nr:hypothetical protein HLPR_10700 [Clostridia bacterium S502]